MSPGKPFTLYRAYGNRDVLLYVGVASNWARRWEKHLSDSPWARATKRLTFEEFANERDAKTAEAAAIKSEMPRYNLQHTGRMSSLRRQPMGIEWVDALSQARESGFVLHVEGYCQQSECYTREVRIKVKDYDGDIPTRMFDAWVCPACGSPLKLHHVRTNEQHRREREVAARASVNVQMYERDTSADCIPCDVLCDTRLPITPAGWFREHKPVTLRNARNAFAQDDGEHNTDAAVFD